MNKPKYYPAKYFFIVITIISLAFLIVNFWQLGKLSTDYKPILSFNKHSQILGEQTEFKSNDYNLVIEKLKINAPVIFDVPGDDEKKYFEALTEGVAHLKGTSKPGEDGNMVIFGHSSADIGASGNYNKVFAELKNLEDGDEIKLLNNQTRNQLVYIVYGREVVEPDDVSIIEQTKKTNLLYLLVGQWDQINNAW